MMKPMLVSVVALLFLLATLIVWSLLREVVFLQNHRAALFRALRAGSITKGEAATLNWMCAYRDRLVLPETRFRLEYTQISANWTLYAIPLQRLNLLVRELVKEMEDAPLSGGQVFPSLFQTEEASQRLFATLLREERERLLEGRD